MCSDTDTRALNVRSLTLSLERARTNLASQDTSISTLTSYVHELDSKSPTGEIWAIWVSQCRRWRHKAIEAYRGPWTVKDGLRKTECVPFCPLRYGADAVAQLPRPLLQQHRRPRHSPLGCSIHVERIRQRERLPPHPKRVRPPLPPSSHPLTKQRFGHCSLAHPSLCTAKVARAYFLEGKVPEYGTTCDADEGFLFPVPGQEVKVLSVEDEELQKALEELAEEVRGFVMKMPTL